MSTSSSLEPLTRSERTQIALKTDDHTHVAKKTMSLATSRPV